MPLNLTLVRHGESTDNLKSLWAGWRDAKLSNHGMNQARCLANYLTDYNIKSIITSDLLRAKCTAEEIFNQNQSDPRPVFTVSELLREQSFGNGEGQPWASVQWQRQSGRDFKFELGESLHDVAKRAETVIDDILLPYVLASATIEEDINVVLVAHGIFIAEIQYALLKRRPQGITEFQRSPLVNTGWHRLRISLATPTQSRVYSSVTENINNVRDNVNQIDENEEIEKQESLVEGPPSKLNPATPLNLSNSKPNLQRKLNVKYLNISEHSHLIGLRRQSGGIGSMAYDKNQSNIKSFIKN